MSHSQTYLNAIYQQNIIIERTCEKLQIKHKIHKKT